MNAVILALLLLFQSYTASAVKDSVLDGRAHISLTITQDSKVTIYDRYVDDADWIADAKAVTADMVTFVMSKQASTPIAVKGEAPVSMTSVEVDAKIQTAEAAKAAEKVKP